MTAFTLAALASFGVVLLAELGDKSQLLALGFATRYRPLVALAGITLATGAVHGVSVAVGSGLGAALPTAQISVGAGVAFLAFALWTVHRRGIGGEDRPRAPRTTRSALATVTVAFVVAELGDKTMLATIALATQYDPWGVWLGSTLGMVAGNAVAIAVGHQVGRWLPDRVVAVGAATLFAVCGAWILADSIPQVLA